ncbi:MAG: hypothetical protein CMP21_08780 [Rickettsiales bacterium]|nr:hypothetical protein [Rickettsiales bacterium]|tara:strand:- start:15556 stop:17259 length:1704 start_codon:yes stop_codon:yes gene_type:complete
MRKDYPSVDKGEVVDPENFEMIQKLEAKFSASKEAKKIKIPRWRRNEELYSGKFLKPFKLPKYKSRVEPNFVHSTVETIYSILTDRNPKVDIMPKREDQIESARLTQEVLDSEMEKRKASRSVAGMKRDGLIYGNGFIKCVMHKGKIEFKNPDPFTVFFDPLATNIENATCIIFATPTYVSEIKKLYKNGHLVVSEGAMNEYRSFVKHDDKYATDKTSDLELDSKSPVDDGIGNETYGEGQALLKEAWYYEEGELCLATWCGNVLLQKEKSPYKNIPLVMFQNYASSHTIWGKGEPEVIESLAVSTSIVLSQALDNLIYHGNPSIVMSKSMMKTYGNRPTDKPGQVFYTNGPHEGVNRLPAGNISSSSLPMAQSLIQLSDQVSGVHDITQGRNPSGVTSGRAISQLQEASQQIIRTKEREVGQDAVISLYKNTLDMLKNNYEQDIEIRSVSEDGQYEFYKIPPYELDEDMDFKYIPGSSLPESRASRFDQALDLVQMGLLTPEQFWRWTQKDISKEILEEMLEQKKAMQEEMQRDQETLENSTDKQQIMDILLKQKAMREQMEGQVE